MKKKYTIFVVIIVLLLVGGGLWKLIGQFRSESLKTDLVAPFSEEESTESESADLEGELGKLLEGLMSELNQEEVILPEAEESTLEEPREEIEEEVLEEDICSPVDFNDDRLYNVYDFDFLLRRWQALPDALGSFDLLMNCWD
ncbi:MAG TPA: hypothetical protein ENI70_01880 [Candidatus Peregrinibacteria bacterium]|nr:hypothetical protein [Candidatus Peregrinibacteria bacterium]